MICFIRIPATVGALNGSSPVSIWIGDDAEAVQVGAAVDLPLARRLLGTHERRRADGHAGAGERGADVDESALAMPKSVTITRPRVPSSRMLSGLMSRWMIERAWAALSASAVSFMIRRASSTGSLPRPRIRAATDSPSTIPHDEIDQPLALADRVDRDDVGMREPGRRLRLAGESLADVLLEGELGRQHLDGHPALQPFVARAIDHAHAAAPDLALDRIRVTERLGEAGGERGHRSARQVGVIDAISADDDGYALAVIEAHPLAQRIATCLRTLGVLLADQNGQSLPEHEVLARMRERDERGGGQIIFGYDTRDRQRVLRVLRRANLLEKSVDGEPMVRPEELRLAQAPAALGPAVELHGLGGRPAPASPADLTAVDGQPESAALRRWVQRGSASRPRPAS